jgi:hypothetical protein
MGEPSIVMALRSRSDPDSAEFVRRYDQFKALLAQQQERELGTAGALSSSATGPSQSGVVDRETLRGRTSVGVELYPSSPRFS